MLIRGCIKTTSGYFLLIKRITSGGSTVVGEKKGSNFTPAIFARWYRHCESFPPLKANLYPSGLYFNARFSPLRITSILCSILSFNPIYQLSLDTSQFVGPAFRVELVVAFLISITKNGMVNSMKQARKAYHEKIEPSQDFRLPGVSEFMS